jgi:hypothetical protein
MKPERFRRTKSVAASSAIALVVAALVLGLSSLVLGPRSASPNHVGTELVSSSCPANPLSPPNFSVCGPTLGHGPVLEPGAAASSVPLTFYNALSVGIAVSSLTVSFASTAFPTNCAPSAFLFNGTAVTGSSPTVSGAQPNVTLTFAAGHYISVPGGSVRTPRARDNRPPSQPRSPRPTPVRTRAILSGPSPSTTARPRPACRLGHRPRRAPPRSLSALRSRSTQANRPSTRRTR